MAFPGRNIGNSPYTESLTDSGSNDIDNNEEQLNRTSTNQPYGKPQHSRAASVRSINVISDEDSDQGDGKSMMDVILQHSARPDSNGNNQELGIADLIQNITSNNNNTMIDDATKNIGFGKNNPFFSNEIKLPSNENHKLEAEGSDGNLALVTAIPGSSKPSTPKIVDTNQPTANHPATATSRVSAGTGFSSGGTSNPHFISAAMMPSENDAAFADTRGPLLHGEVARSIRSSRSVASQTPIADRFSGPINSAANHTDLRALNSISFDNNQKLGKRNHSKALICDTFIYFILLTFFVIFVRCQL